MRQSSIFGLIFLIFSTPLSMVYADAGIKPDIRNYDVLVDNRLMPSQTCGGLTPAEWVAKYVGYNQLAGNTMKYSDYLFGMSDQVDRAADRLSPYVFKQAANKTVDETGNPTTWVAQICWYQNGQLMPPIISDQIIESEKPITDVPKKIRGGSMRLSAFLAQNVISLVNGIYPMQRPPLVPDPNRQSPCPTTPEGAEQTSTADKGQGINQFWSINQLVTDIACAFICHCVPTKMFIRADSTIPYNTGALCTGPGCTAAQVNQVDEQSRATPEEQNSKGWMNATARPGIMVQIIEMAEKIFGSITGKVAKQTTKNNVNTPSADASYYTAEGEEAGMKFTNCTLFPYVKRDSMPECNTNWLLNALASYKSELQGTLSQNTSESSPLTPTPTPTP